MSGEMEGDNRNPSFPPPGGDAMNPSAGPSCQGKKRDYLAYKLIVDPFLVKGALKTYRFDGHLPDDPTYPTVVVRDPRNPVLVKMKRHNPDDFKLRVPYFKVDRNYVGRPPAIHVTITNVNDNIGISFLTDIINKQYQHVGEEGLESVKVLYHPVTNKHLGLAHAVFKRPAFAKLCVEKLNNMSIMGQKLSVFIDSFGEKCDKLVEELTTAPKKQVPEEKQVIESKKGAAGDKSRDVVDKASVQASTSPHKGEPDPRTPTKSLPWKDNVSNGTLIPVSSNHIAASSKDPVNGYESAYDPYHHPPLPPQCPQYDPSSPLAWAKHGSQSANTTPVVTPTKVPEIYSAVTVPDEESKSNQDDGFSPKMDLDTRIKMIFAGSRSNELGFRFSIGDDDISSEEDECPPSKRTKLGIDGSELWGSESEEDTVESAFAKKFKRNTFVPVMGDDGENGKDRMGLSPPPSPFLNGGDNVPLSTLQSLKQKLESELEKISDDSNGLSPLRERRSWRKAKSTGMSGSPVTPEDPSKIHLPPIPPPIGTIPPPPIPSEELKDANRFNSQYYNGAFPFSSHGLNGMPWGMPGIPHDPNYSHPYALPGMPYQTHFFSAMPPYPEEKLESEEDKEDEEDEMFLPKNITVMVEAAIYLELRMTLLKDVRRRVMENEAYNKFSSWCEKREQHYKETAKIQQEAKSVSIPPVSSSLDKAPVFDFKSSDSVIGGPFKSMMMGIRSSIPKLPSFRRPREILPTVKDSDTSEESDDESVNSDDNEPTVQRKTLRRLSFSSDSSLTSSSSDSSSEEETDVESISSFESEEEQITTDVKVPIPTTHDLLLETESISDDSYSDLDDEKDVKVNEEIGKDKAIPDVKSMEEQIELPSTVAETRVKDEAIKIESEEELEEERYFVDPRIDHCYSKHPDQEEVDLRNKWQHLAIQQLQLTVQKTTKFTPKTFPYRNTTEKSRVLYDFYHSGVDAEDLKFFKMAFETALSDDSNSYWLNSAHWVDHPTSVTAQKRSQSTESTRVHETGCARTEGFYKLNLREKASNRKQWGIRTTEAEQTIVVTGSSGAGATVVEKSAGKTQLTVTREARSNQRRLLTALGSEVDSDLLKFNQLKFRKKSLIFKKSAIHDWGLFAREPIAADEMVIEYVGQMIRPVVADLRERQYELVGIGSSYLFRIDLETIIDATRCGNLSRFINHSCNPNCYAKIITIEGKKKIVIYSKQPIGVNEEITYDYKFPIEDDKIPCLCGSLQCRGTLN